MGNISDRKLFLITTISLIFHDFPWFSMIFHDFPYIISPFLADFSLTSHGIPMDFRSPESAKKRAEREAETTLTLLEQQRAEVTTRRRWRFRGENFHEWIFNGYLMDISPNLLIWSNFRRHGIFQRQLVGDWTNENGEAKIAWRTGILSRFVKSSWTRFV